ncbi:MAG: hypothetical protein JKY44_07260 [Flavobacteriaceae bacterium]|nr:hypothetical protein [Flavobacteriaceae bacterium]
MNKLKTNLGVLAIILVSLTIMSCKDNKKEHNNNDGHHSEMKKEMHSTMNHDSTSKKDTETNVINYQKKCGYFTNYKWVYSNKKRVGS